MRKIQPVVKKYKLGEEPSDVLYWLNKSVKERAIAIEFLRQLKYEEGNGRNRVQRKLQRVYRVVELKKS